MGVRWPVVVTVAASAIFQPNEPPEPKPERPPDAVGSMLLDVIPLDGLTEQDAPRTPADKRQRKVFAQFHDFGCGLNPALQLVVHGLIALRTV